MITTRALVVLADGFEEIEAITPIDILRRAGLTVTVASLDTNETDHIAVGAHGLVCQADALLSEVDSSTPDVLVLPGGMPGSENLGSNIALRALAMQTLRSKRLLAAICAAPVKTLGRWGLLNNLPATCFPGLEKEFPQEVKVTDADVVVTDHVITARAAGAAMDFSLAIVRHLGDSDAEELASRIYYRYYKT